MTSLLNGAPVLSGSLRLPRRGPWTAELDVGASVLPGPSATLELGALSLTGRVLSATLYGAQVRVQLVAGAGDLGRELPPLGWTRRAGVELTRRTPWSATVQGAGESVSPDTAPALLDGPLTAWYRRRGRALWCLDALAAQAGAVWRFDDRGRVLLVVDDWRAVALPDAAEPEHAGPEGCAVSLEEPIAELRPGTTVLGKRVATVTYTLGDDTVTAELAFERAGLEEDPDTAATRLLVQRELYALGYQGLSEGAVQSQDDDGRVSVRLDGDMPSVVRCPVAVPLPGATVRLGVGTRVLVAWMQAGAGTPQFPVALPAGLSWGTGSGMSLLKLGAGTTHRVARVGDGVDASPEMAAWMTEVNAAIHALRVSGTVTEPGAGPSRIGASAEGSALFELGDPP